MSHLSSEVKYLLESSQESSNQDALEQLLKQSINFSHLYFLATANGVLPLLPKNTFPKKAHVTAEFFKQDLLMLKKRNFFMSAQLLQLHYLLQEKNIEIIPIKGPLLAQHAYKDVALRPFSDLDILIQEKDLVNVANVLISLGYKNEHPLESLTHPYILKKFADISFVHPQTNIIIELHWQLLSTASAELSNIQNLFKNSHPIILQNMPVQSLPLEEEFLYLSIHAAKHRFERIEWMNDLNLLFQEHSHEYNWERLLQMARNEKALRPYLLGLCILKNSYHKEIPHQESQKLLKNRKILRLYDEVWKLHSQDYILKEKRQGIRYKEIFFAIKLEDSCLRKLSILKSIILPLHKDDILSFPQLPASLSFLYYFARLKRVLKKK